jgi:membrane-associated phospholipid phosphatase
MRSVWKQNKLPVLIFGCWIIAVTVLLLFTTKSSLHLSINRFHTSYFDWFFAHATHIGDGLFVVVAAVLFALFSFRKAIIILVAYLSSGLLVQIMKRLIFPDAQRPAAYFSEDVLRVIEGVNMLHYKAFPSGHATTAVAFGFCLVFITKNQTAKVLFLLFSLIIAFSRVYISQHFMEDIYVGSIIGFVCSLITYFAIQRNSKKWLDQSFISLIK